MDDIDTMIDNNLTPIPTVSEPQQARTMDFPDAVRQIMNGKKVARVAWGNNDYGLLRNGWLTIYHKKAGEANEGFYTWNVSDGDLEGNDWVIVEVAND